MASSIGRVDASVMGKCLMAAASCAGSFMASLLSTSCSSVKCKAVRLSRLFKWLLNEQVAYAKKYPYDPARAKALLAKAGVKPDSVTVRLPFDLGRPQMRAQSQIIQDNLRQIGIEVKLEPLLGQKMESTPDYNFIRGWTGADALSDEHLDAFIKRKVESAYHPSGTCRMGVDDDAVTHPDGRVRGVEALRVIDASVMPQATAGDLNAPTLVLAERMADLIRGRHLPEATDAPLLAASEWACSQRTPTVQHDYSRDRASLREALLFNARIGAFEVKQV